MAKQKIRSGEFPVDRAAAPGWLTVPLARVYERAVRWQEQRLAETTPFRPPVPVISVGNITVGGSGKTPCVMALARLLMEMEPALAKPNAVAVLSRGYGRESRDLVVVEPELDYRQCGDEPLLIKRSVPTAAVVVHAERSVAARHAVETLGAKLLLLDDGFQHRRLARDLDLVLVDGQYPVGNGHLLPAGPLREPLGAIERATALIGVGGEVDAARRFSAQAGKRFLQATPRFEVPNSLCCRPVPVFVLSAIARPSRFRAMLEANGLEIKGEASFRDHHRFTDGELVTVARRAAQSGAAAVVTTAKDRLRISRWEFDIPLYVADLWLDFVPLGELRNWLKPHVDRVRQAE